MRYLLFLLPGLLLAAHATTPEPKNFKVSGSPLAPIQIELYTDYQCPACRDFYLNTLPLLISNYVQTGKVRLTHRDFLISGHQFTKVAARYANAAGEIGKYDTVARQLFLTQPEWSVSGNVDAEVAKVLSPADMQKVRAMATGNDPKLDQMVEADMAVANQDNLRQTPTIVIVAKGKREVIGGGPPYSVLKAYLDKKLSE